MIGWVCPPEVLETTQIRSSPDEVILKLGHCEVEIIDIRGTRFTATHENVPLVKGGPDRWLLTFSFDPPKVAPDSAAAKSMEAREKNGALLNANSPCAADGSFFDPKIGPPRRMRVVFPGKFYFEWTPNARPDVLFAGDILSDQTLRIPLHTTP